MYGVCISLGQFTPKHELWKTVSIHHMSHWSHALLSSRQELRRHALSSWPAWKAKELVVGYALGSQQVLVCLFSVCTHAGRAVVLVVSAQHPNPAKACCRDAAIACITRVCQAVGSCIYKAPSVVYTHVSLGSAKQIRCIACCNDHASSTPQAGLYT